MKKTTLVYLIKNHQWLMLLRNKKAHDVNHGKWIGVGGKVEDNESVEECAIREVYEETGYHIDELSYHGIVYFKYADEEIEKMYVYSSKKFHGEEKECDEGTLAWKKEDEILNLDLWEGDRIFLQEMIQSHVKPFVYELFYDKDSNLINYRKLEE